MQSLHAFGVSHPRAIVLYCLGVVCCAVGCASQKPRASAQQQPPAARPAAAEAPAEPAAGDPGVEREIRGLFVATVFNTDWPSRPGLDALVAQDEIRAILDRAEELNCNAIFLQVRSMGDRIYERTGPRAPERPDPTTRPEIPWSVAVDGGQRYPGYDPLQTWIVEAHARGIELHAWVNPFRIDVPIRNFPIRDGGDGFLYADPTSQVVQDYVVDVIEDLLTNYGTLPKPAPPQPAAAPAEEPGEPDGGLDGVIVDHYFPNPGGGPEPATGPSTNPAGAQPAGPSCVTTQPTTLPARRAWILKNWHNAPPPPPPPSLPKTLKDFIQAVASPAHTANVRFGVSPMAGQQGLVKDWLPLVDYIAPEIYCQRPAFEPELDLWIADAAAADPRPLVVPVLYTARVQTRKKGEPKPWPRSEIDEQIKLVDLKKPRLGHIHYSYHAIRSPAQGGPKPDNNIGDKLKEVRYKNPIPPGWSTTALNIAPDPLVPNAAGDIELKIQGVNVRYWVFRRRLLDGTWELEQQTRKKKDNVIKAAELDATKYNLVRVWAVDNRARESLPAERAIP